MNLDRIAVAQLDTDVTPLRYLHQRQQLDGGHGHGGATSGAGCKKAIAAVRRESAETKS